MAPNKGIPDEDELDIPYTNGTEWRPDHNNHLLFTLWSKTIFKIIITRYRSISWKYTNVCRAWAATAVSDTSIMNIIIEISFIHWLFGAHYNCVAAATAALLSAMKSKIHMYCCALRRLRRAPAARRQEKIISINNLCTQQAAVSSQQQRLIWLAQILIDDGGVRVSCPLFFLFYFHTRIHFGFFFELENMFSIETEPG